MIFSTKSEYGLRALIKLAKHYGQEPYSLAKIAQEEGISLAYLERLFAKLKKDKIVKSAKGASGGYSLTRVPGKISIAEVFISLEGSLAPFHCVDEGIKGACSSNLCGCKTKIVWQKLYQNLTKTLQQITLSSLL